MTTETDGYVTDDACGDMWRLMLGDSCERMAEIPDESVDLSVCSPPFASLFVYSPSVRDLGNSSTRTEFLDHYRFIIREQLRITKPGRNACVHVQQLTTSKVTHGHIGLTDFRGDVIRAFQDEGWIFYGEATIWKDPQAQSIRTHSYSLAFQTKNRDSMGIRPALADYLLIFKKPGDNAAKIPHDAKGGDFTNDEWIEWASPIWFDRGEGAALGGEHISPVWTDIKETNTLNVRAGRDPEDERHICLAEGSLVLTRDGYVPIETVPVGGEVLTHHGRWRAVTAKRCNGIEPVIRTCAQGVADLRTTADHMLWARRGVGPHAKARAQSAAPEWIPASETLGSYLNLPLPPIEESPLSEHECWVIGRWLGDGHRASAHRRSGVRGGTGQFILSCARGEFAELSERLGHQAGAAHDPGTDIQVSLRNLSPDLRATLARCGEGAHRKRVPGELLTLPQPKAEALLAGYLSADGHYVGRYDRWTASSVSRALLLGMAMVAQRARGVVASVYAGRPERKHVIDGRSVVARQDWIFAFRNSEGYRQSGWIDTDGAWKKVRRSQPSGFAEVWDLQVEDDASFVAEGAVVHNCPLQLDFIDRCVRMYSRQGETVFTPFAGIGSELYVSVKRGRRALGIELKPSYWETAVKTLRGLDDEMSQPRLFEL